MYATADARVIVTADIVGFLALAAETLRTNTEHAGIILVPARFWSDEFDAIGRAVGRVARRYPAGLRGAVLYLSRGER